MNKEIIAILEGVHNLLPSLIEIVVHSIEGNKIIYKKGTLTKRIIGDHSYLEQAADYRNIDNLVYDYTAINEKELRSISIPIYEGSVVKELICINCDISIFTQMQSISDNFLNVKTNSKPTILFQNDYKEKIDNWIIEELKTQQLMLEELTSKMKKKLILKLYKQNAFKEKNAADHIASSLKMGRATIFKYLKEWRNNNDK